MWYFVVFSLRWAHIDPLQLIHLCFLQHPRLLSMHVKLYLDACMDKAMIIYHWSSFLQILAVLWLRSVSRKGIFTYFLFPLVSSRTLTCWCFNITYTQITLFNILHADSGSGGFTAHWASAVPWDKCRFTTAALLLSNSYHYKAWAHIHSEPHFTSFMSALLSF